MSLLDELFGAEELRGAVDGVDGDQAFALKIKGRKALGARFAAQDKTVVALKKARDLKLQIILVRPEPRGFQGRRRRVQNGGGRQLGAFNGVVDALQTAGATAVRRNWPAGAIADGENGGVGGAGVAVGDDPVLGFEAGGLRQAHFRQDADPNDHEIGRDFRSVLKTHAGDALVAGDESGLGRQRELHPLRGVVLEEKGRDLWACDPGKGSRGGLDHGDIQAKASGDGGHLQANIARADDGQARAGADMGADRVDVGGGAQGVDAREVCAGDRQGPGAGACGEDQGVVGDLLAIIGADAFGGAVYGGGGGVEPERDAFMIVGFEIAKQEPVFAPFASQIFLGQRRALIGGEGLFANQGDGASKASRPEPKSGFAACLPCADDDNPFNSLRHGGSPLFAGFTRAPRSITEAAGARQAGLEAGAASPQHCSMQKAAVESDEIPLADEAATLALGARLAAALKAGDFLALSGPLGAGKTTLARGLIRAWTGDEEIEAPSPTFTLAQIYEGPKGALWHMDLYRLRSPEEALEIGLEEALGAALCVVEWPERLGGLMPASRTELALRAERGGRLARLRWFGDAAARHKEFSFS